MSQGSYRFTLDANGNPISDKGSSTSTQYDANGNITGSSKTENSNISTYDANGNITVKANVTLKTDNAWYTPIPGVAPSDGLGFQFTDTAQVLFLKLWPSGYPASFAIGDEELVNIVTESGIEIYGEFGDIDGN